MSIAERITSSELWKRSEIVRGWDGWTKYGPAAGSVLAHATVGVALVGLVAATTQPAPASTIAISLVAEAETPPPVPVEPRTPEPSSPQKPRPQQAPRKEAAPERVGSAAPSSEDDSAAPGDTDTVYIPPSPLASAADGLKGLIDDPCKSAAGLKLKDCERAFAGKIGEATAWNRMTKQEKQTYFGEFMATCALKVGCDEKEWISLAGTRSVGKPGPGSREERGTFSMAGGAAGLGGMHETVGRLGFNGDHTDPGFGD